MKTENKMLMLEAWKSLKGRWWLAISGVFLCMIMGIIFESLRSLFLSNDSMIAQCIALIVYGPLTVGLAHFFIKISREQKAFLKDILTGFKMFTRNVLASLAVFILVALGYKLFIIPGVILALMFSQVAFILAEDDSINVFDSMKKSIEMVNGNKRKLLSVFSQLLIIMLVAYALIFVPMYLPGLLVSLSLAALPLIVLIIVVFYILFAPFAMVTMAKFYDDIKGEHSQVHDHTKAEEKHEVVEAAENKEATN